MAKIYETLRKKNDPTIEVYPNIETQNIPNGAVTETKLGTGAVTTGKLANSSVNYNKLADGSVTSSKLSDSAVITSKVNDGAITSDKLGANAVTNLKIQNNAITTDKIQNSAVTNDKISDESISDGKLNDNLWNFYKNILNSKMIYIANDDETTELFLGTFVYDDELDEYDENDIKHAIDFDKASSSDYTSTDLQILNYIIEKSNKQFITNHGTTFTRLYTADDKYQFIMGSATANDNVIRMEDLSTNTTLFKLEWDKNTKVITSYINTNYIYIYFYDLFGSGNWER